MATATQKLNEDDRRRLASASNAFAVTPSDTANNEFTYISEYFWIGGAGSGNLKVLTAGGQTVAFTGVTAGYFWIRARQVFDTDTDVTGIVGHY